MVELALFPFLDVLTASMTLALASPQPHCLVFRISPPKWNGGAYRVSLPFRGSLKVHHAVEAGIIRIATLVPVRVELLLRQDVPALLDFEVISIAK